MHPQTSFGKPQARTDRKSSSFDVGKATLRQLGKFIGHTFGTTLPDDDWGRDVIYELLNQQALNGFSPHMMRRYAINLLPEIGDDDSLDNMLQDIGGGTRRNADDLGRRIGLDLKTRELLEITCIGAGDCPKPERMAIKAQLYAANKKWKREKGRMARAATGEPAPKAAPSRRKPKKKATGRRRGRPSLGEPWMAAGVSRRTWFRCRAATKSGGTKFARRMALNSDQLAAAEPNEKYQQTQHDRCRSRGTKIGAGKNGGPKLTDSPPLSRVEQGAGTDRPASSAPSVEGAVAKPRESRRDLDLSRTSETVATLFGSADEPFCALRPPLTSDGAHDDAEVVVRCPHTLELFPDEEADDDWSPSIHCLAVKSASSCDLPHSPRLASRIGQ